MYEQVKLSCAGCKTVFLKVKKEYDRQIRKGRTEFYCTRQCFGLNVSPKNLQTEKAIAWRISKENRQAIAKRNKERTRNPFKSYLHQIKKRNHDIDVDEKYLRTLWDEQSGKCAFSGLSMEHIYFDCKTDAFTAASIDRINSSKGYVKGNIQFVIRALNLAKGAEDNGRFLEFLHRLSKALDKPTRERLNRN